MGIIVQKRRTPERKCLGCNEMLGKKGMLRVVRSKDGEISLDLTGKKPGRGAYICKDTECLKKAQKRKGFERSLKCSVSEDVYNALSAEIEELNE